MEDVIQICPKCQSSNHTNKDLKFRVSYCGHSICDKCYELVFQKHEGSCPKCDSKLQRNSFRQRIFDNDSVESYLSYYFEVTKTFNCDRSDFDTLEEFNDYLEEVETLIHNLMDKDKHQEARNKIQEYKSQNKAEIKLRRNRKNKDIETYENWEKDEIETRNRVNDDIKREKQDRENIDEIFTRRLITTNEPIEDVMRDYTRAVGPDTNRMLSRGDGRSVQSLSTLQLTSIKAGQMYRYETPAFMIDRYPPFQYGRQTSETGFRAAVLLSTMRPGTGLLRGGGFTPELWFYRLRHFCG